MRGFIKDPGPRQSNPAIIVYLFIHEDNGLGVGLLGGGAVIGQTPGSATVVLRSLFLGAPIWATGGWS